MSVNRARWTCSSLQPCTVTSVLPIYTVQSSLSRTSKHPRIVTRLHYCAQLTLWQCRSIAAGQLMVVEEKACWKFQLVFDCWGRSLNEIIYLKFLDLCSKILLNLIKLSAAFWFYLMRREWIFLFTLICNPHLNLAFNFFVFTDIDDSPDMNHKRGVCFVLAVIKFTSWWLFQC